VVDYFNDNYDGLGESVVYVNPAYKIGAFYKLSTRFAELNKLKMIIAAYKEEGKFSDEQMKEFAEGETAPEDYPKIKSGFYGKKPVNSQEVDDEFKEVEESI
jgi:hypothetical protein